MNTASHITAQQAAGYQQGTLPADVLRAVDLHLSECAECRDALFAKLGAEAQLSEWRARFSEHLSYEQVAAFAEGKHDDREAAAHLNECAACRGEVEDLRAFRGELRDAPRQLLVMPARPKSRQYTKWMVVAAAAVTVVVGFALWNRHSPAPAAPKVVAQQSPSPRLSPEQEQAVQTALATGKLERAPVLDRLLSHRGVLLGDGQEARTFELSGPLGTAVLDDRPTLSWQPLRGASQYVVSIFDENFRRVAQSPAISATQWQLTTPLPRGRVYVWQVTAKAGADTVRSPIPPAPEARFQVAPADAATQIGQLRREQPNNHLALAVLLAKAGALDDAAAELDALARTEPDQARPLRESLAEIRRR